MASCTNCRTTTLLPKSTWPILLALLGGCGGGSDESGPTTDSVSFRSPTISGGTYETDQAQLSFHGSVTIPADTNITCSSVTLPDIPGVSVSVRNQANGASQVASDGVNCFGAVSGFWDTGLMDIDMGANRITATSSNGGSATITVNRVPDTVGPRVTEVSPRSGETGVSRYVSTVWASFDEVIDVTTLTVDSFTLVDGDGLPVVGTVSTNYYDDRVIFTPDNPIRYETTYTATLTTGITDLVGNSIATDFVWQFTTEIDPDMTPPMLSRTEPEDGSGCAAPDTVVKAFFNERMLPSSITANTFTLEDQSRIAVGATVVTIDDVATLTPDAPLTVESTYTARLDDTVADDAGNLLGATSWSFTIAPPQAGTWSPIATPTVLAGRYLHSAVWTGTEMIIWGGLTFYDMSSRFAPDHAAYSLAQDSWRSISDTNAPELRWGHTAVWTGSEMLIWGGSTVKGTGGETNTGGRYDPIADSWTPMSTTNAPSGLKEHTAIWTGEEMIVWGGTEAAGGDYSGGRYNPASDTWTRMSTTNAPTRRTLHNAVWTGSEMVVWGGRSGSNTIDDGARYNPSTDTWTPLPTDNAPNTISPGEPTQLPPSVTWTGTEMIVWNGYRNTGRLALNPDTGVLEPVYVSEARRYDPISDTWATASDPCDFESVAVGRGYWLNERMFSFTRYLTYGYGYRAAGDAWFPIAAYPESGTGLRNQTVVSTGNTLLVWGGNYDTQTFPLFGYRLDP